jgi:MFS family permease
MTLRTTWTRLAGRGPLGTFAVAHVVAGAGDAFVAVSLAGSLFFNVSPNASRQQILLYLALTMAPFAVLAPLIGPAVDRFHGAHRGLASLTYVLRAAAAVALSFTLFDLAFYPLALGLLIASKASGVIRQALVPRLVDEPEHLVAANSGLAWLGTVFASAAAAVAAVFLGPLGAKGLLGIAAILFLVAAAVVWRIPRALPSWSTPAEMEYAELHTPGVILASSGLMALRAGVGYFMFTLAFELRRGSRPAWAYGLVLGAYGLGAFLGNVIAPAARRRVDEQVLMAGALAAASALCFVAVLGPGLGMLALVAAVLGLAASIGRQAFDSLLQRTAPDALRGQAFSRYETRFQLTWVLGAFLATAVVLPIQAAMALLAALFVTAMVIYTRGARDALRFGAATRTEGVASAAARLEEALEWQRAGRPRRALVEAAVAVDLARLAGPCALSDTELRRVDDLRRAALDGDSAPADDDVAEVLDLARRALGVSPPESST